MIIIIKPSKKIANAVLDTFFEYNSTISSEKDDINKPTQNRRFEFILFLDKTLQMLSKEIPTKKIILNDNNFRIAYTLSIVPIYHKTIELQSVPLDPCVLFESDHLIGIGCMMRNIRIYYYIAPMTEY